MIKNNSLIKVILALIITGLLSTLDPLQAGPFLKIDKINSESEFPKIKISLTVRDFEKAAISGINEENIALYEDGYMVNYIRVKNLSANDNVLYMVFGIDSSKSISPQLLKELKKSADDFFTYIGPNDLVALYRFNDEVQLLNNFTNNKAEILKNIDSINRHGSKTLFYNALYDSIDLLNKTNVPRKVLIAFTDGKDEGSSIETDDVIKFARDSHVPIFIITFNPQDRIKVLTRMCFLTGGTLFNTGKKDISAIYKTIMGSVKNQYLLEYKTMLEPDGRSHNIELRLKYGNLRDRAETQISFKKPITLITIQSPYEIILIALVSIFIIIFIIFAVFYFLYNHRGKKKSENDSSKNIFHSAKAEEVQQEKEKSKFEEKPGETEPVDEPIKTNAWLVEREGINAGNKISIEHEETLIGRDKENNIIINDKSVSKKHAKIKLIKNSFYLFDMASDKGTFLNENKLLRPKLLYDWDEIRIGKKIFIFRVSHVA